MKGWVGGGGGEAGKRGLEQVRLRWTCLKNNNNNNDNVLFFVPPPPPPPPQHTHTGVHSPLQSKEPKQSKQALIPVCV